MRLIDADALRDALGITGTADSCKGCKYNDRFEFVCNTDAAPTFEYVCEMIDDAPTIEERKTGKWNRRKGMYEVGFKCSECNSFSIAETPYCSFCGAMMVQEGEEHEWSQRN